MDRTVSPNHTEEVVTPFFLLFVGSLAQILWLAFDGFFHWRQTSQPHRPLFIKRWSENISLEIINKISLPLALVPLGFFFKETKNHFPSFNALEFNVLHTLSALIFLDFVFYWRHRFYHFFLQRWHRTHHNDSGFDMSLTLRFHPFENLINDLILVFGLFLLQLSPWEMLFVIQVFSIQALLSHRSRSQTGARTFQVWNRIFVTPTTHRLHHDQNASSGNYGFLFCLWDHLFRTSLIAPDDRKKEGL